MPGVYQSSSFFKPRKTREVGRGRFRDFHVTCGSSAAQEKDVLLTSFHVLCSDPGHKFRCGGFQGHIFGAGTSDLSASLFRISPRSSDTRADQAHMSSTCHSAPASQVLASNPANGRVLFTPPIPPHPPNRYQSGDRTGETGLDVVD